MKIDKQQSLIDCIKGFMKREQINNASDLEIWSEDYNTFYILDKLCEIVGYQDSQQMEVNK